MKLRLDATASAMPTYACWSCEAVRTCRQGQGEGGAWVMYATPLHGAAADMPCAYRTHTLPRPIWHTHPPGYRFPSKPLVFLLRAPADELPPSGKLPCPRSHSTRCSAAAAAAREGV